MISYSDLYTIEETVGKRLEEKVHKAEIHRQIRQARTARAGWWSRHGRLLLSQLGHLLVALGQRLEKYGLSRSLAAES